MQSAFDLDAYFERIGYRNAPTVSLETLEAIHLLHTQAIAFENLNPLLHWPVPLDVASLQQKLVAGGRGGYCFEHNLLLSHALTTIGFDVTWLAARVHYTLPEGTTTPRSHMLLLIRLAGTTYVADVGFGGLTLTGPLRLEANIEQATPHEPFRLMPDEDAFVMQANIGGWKNMYRFDLQKQLLPDYEVTNWYLSNHPNSLFVTGLMVARPDKDRRYALRNNTFTVHHLDGRTERRVLTDADELRATLSSVFRVRLPNAPELDAALSRLAACPPSP